MNEICLSCKKHTKCGRAIHETIGCGYYAPLTNEEWLEQASTEEKAKLLSKLCKFIYNCGEKGSIPKFMYEEDFVHWLKEKHHE